MERKQRRVGRFKNKHARAAIQARQRAATKENEREIAEAVVPACDRKRELLVPMLRGSARGYRGGKEKHQDGCQAILWGDGWSVKKAE